MNLDNDKKYIHVHKTALLIVALVLVAGVVGWMLGRGRPSPNTNTTIPTQSTTPSSSSDAPGVSSLVSYVLPDGWKEARCEGSAAIFAVPSGSGVDCKANPTSAVKLSVDSTNSTDCNQLQNVTDVKKHVCVSVFINGHKSLKASTEYLASSSYKQATTIDSYYVDTGKGVVKVEYIHTTDNQYQAGFDQLANSVKLR